MVQENEQLTCTAITRPEFPDPDNLIHFTWTFKSPSRGRWDTGLTRIKSEENSITYIFVVAGRYKTDCHCLL